MKKMRMLMMCAVVLVAFGALADGPAFGSGAGRSPQLGSGALTEEQEEGGSGMGSGNVTSVGTFGSGYLVETYIDELTGEEVVVVIELP